MKTVAVIVALSLVALAFASTPAVPVWPDSFVVKFSEQTKIISEHTTSGVYYYDASNNRERMDRVSGEHDRYCGSVKDKDIPCTHLVVDDKRWLYWPSISYCCMCCTSDKGCGITAPNWLQTANATYVGTETVDGRTCNKWSAKGLQSNYWLQDDQGVPCALDMEPNDLFTFDGSSYKETKIPDSAFELPSYCSDKCPLFSICTVAEHKLETPKHIREN